MSKATLFAKLFVGICTILCFQFVACKEISVNDDDLDRIEGIFDDEDDSSESDQTTSYEDEDSESNTDDIESEETSGDSTDPTGGLEYWSSTEKGTNRTFIGTYEYKQSYDDCTDSWGADLDLPSVLRGYAHGDYIDFETSLSQLVWSAIIYPDDTFDFQTRYLDQFGNPSVTLTCTCAINEYYWEQESIECACDASHYDEACNLRYDLM